MSEFFDTQSKVEEKGLLITLVWKMFQLKFLYFVYELIEYIL